MIKELTMEIKKLKDIGLIFNGNSINATVKKEKYLNIEDGLPYIATKDVNYKSIINYDNGVRIPFIEKENFKIAPKNTILICAEGGSAGRKIGFTKQEVCFGNKLFAFTPNSKTDSKYVYYFYFSNSFQKTFHSQMTGIIGGVSMNKFKNLEIPLPPLPQQKQIVATLDKAFAFIDTAKANAEQNLLNAKELFESCLQNVFENKGDDWEEKTLKQISDDFGRGKSKHRPRNDKKLYGGNYPFIQTGDIRNSEHFITDYSQTYNEIGLAQSKLWPKGTICITIAANIAETGILSFDACFPDSVIGIVVDNKQAEIDYVEYLLQYFKVNIQSLSQGSAQENINLGTFEGKLFPFALLEEQKKIVDKLDALSSECKKLETIYNQKITDLEEIKKSVLQKAFSGQLSTIN